MRQLRYLNAVLTVIAVLLTLNLWVAWHATPGGQQMTLTQEASAQGLADAGAQRREMVDLLKQINVSIGQVRTTLTDGSVKVSTDPKGE